MLALNSRAGTSFDTYGLLFAAPGVQGQNLAPVHSQNLFTSGACLLTDACLLNGACLVVLNSACLITLFSTCCLAADALLLAAAASLASCLPPRGVQRRCGKMSIPPSKIRGGGDLRDACRLTD